MEKNYKIISSDSITKDDIKSICALERKYYKLPVEQQFSVRKTTALHKLNNNDLVVLKDMDKNQVIGFISMIPIKWNCYKKIRSGKYFDTIINVNNVKVYDNPGFYNLYISSIVIDKENYSYACLKQLLDGIYRKAWNLAVFKSIYIRNILADTITKDGERLCKSLGFTKVKKTTHDSSIYEFEMIKDRNYDILFKHNEEMGKSLINIYDRYIKESKFSYRVKTNASKAPNAIKRWLKYVFVIRPENKRLLKKYPFLRYHPECTEGIDAIPYFKKHPYRKTFLDEMPEGWRNSFGIQMCEDIKNRIIEYDKAHGTDFLHEYSLVQIKEKWGALCWYDGGTPSDLDLDDIISYYEDLSMTRCIICGKPTKYVTLGWINYICEDCKEHELTNPREARLATLADVPHRKHYDQETDTWTDIESKVNFKEIWPEPEEE